MKIVSSLHVATVETQRYAFLLFSVILTVARGIFFAFRVSCWRHETSCSHRKLLCTKFINSINFIALFSKGNSVYFFEN
jgi:hypothetical protein